MNTFSATFTTPATYALGVSKRAVMGGTMAVDIRMQQFDRFQDLPLNFSQNIDSKGRPTGTEAEQRLTFNFNNAYMLQAGYERPFGNGGMLKSLTQGATWRAGYVWDVAPTPHKSIGPLFPDTTRHSWTAGMTKPVGNFDMTFFYQFMQFMNTTTNVAANRNQFTNGSDNSFANIVGLGMRWRLGGHDGKVE